MTKPDFVLLLGDKNLSSWSLRPWLLMRHAGIAFEEHVVLFEEESWREKIVALSPSRKVPALRHRRGSQQPAEELLVWDSLAIAEYIADLFPEKQLWPEDRAARAVARAVSAEMHSGFASLRKDMSMNVTARRPRRTVSRETQVDIDRVQAIWADCRKRFGADGPFLFGCFSVADAMYAPVVWRFRTYDVPLIPEVRSWY
jgi:glutathione S-transferase